MVWYCALLATTTNLLHATCGYNPLIHQIVQCSYYNNNIIYCYFGGQTSRADYGVGCDAHRHRFEFRPKAAFFFGKSRCPERSAAISHPGMADTYGCPLKYLPRPKTHVFTNLQFLPYKQKQTANGQSCQASWSKNNYYYILQ